MRSNLLSLFSTPICIINSFITKEESKHFFEVALSKSHCFQKHSVLLGDSVSSHEHGSNFFEWFEPNKLKNRIQEQLDIFSNNIGFQKSVISNSWVNIQEEGSVLEVHAHPLSVLSGALYLNVDQLSSKLFFFNPNPVVTYLPVDHNKHSNNNFSYFFVEPSIGDLVIFPSWLQHGSARDINKTKNRTVVSFNTILKT